MRFGFGLPRSLCELSGGALLQLLQQPGDLNEATGFPVGKSCKWGAGGAARGGGVVPIIGTFHRDSSVPTGGFCPQMSPVIITPLISKWFDTFGLLE